MRECFSGRRGCGVDMGYLGMDGFWGLVGVSGNRRMWSDGGFY